jgi:hypothetical protein
MNNVEIQWKQFVLNGWVRLPNSESCFLSMRSPGHFSGTIPINVRGTIVDFSMSGQAVKSSGPVTINVNILPDADDVNLGPSKTVGVEDGEPLPFGNTLAGVRVKDNGNTRQGNNPETETFSRVQLKVPSDSANLKYNFSATTFLPESYESVGGVVPGSKTARISYDPSSRTFAITSTIITEASNIGSLSITDRRAASTDIINTLKAFKVEIGPKHSDQNGSVQCEVTTLDVNLGSYSERKQSFVHDLIVLAVADVRIY